MVFITISTASARYTLGNDRLRELFAAGEYGGLLPNGYSQPSLGGSRG